MLALRGTQLSHVCGAVHAHALTRPVIALEKFANRNTAVCRLLKSTAQQPGGIHSQASRLSESQCMDTTDPLHQLKTEFPDVDVGQLGHGESASQIHRVDGLRQGKRMYLNFRRVDSECVPPTFVGSSESSAIQGKREARRKLVRRRGRARAHPRFLRQRCVRLR